MRLEAVRKRYRRGPEVLTGVDLELTAGAPVVVLGGNGTGKSTLLRIAAGCAAASSGRVVGRPRRVGYLPADLPAPERTPARVWLAHLAAIRGTDPASASRVLDALGFTGGLDAPLARLSTGNWRKVGLAQALGGSPGLVVLDEPWSGLDDAAGAALDDALRAATCPVLVTDHTGRGAATAGAEVRRLAAGRLQRVPPPVAHAVVELRCPVDPAVAVTRLPPVTGWWSDGPVLTVRVPAERGDALLAAALAAGCSVLTVRRDP
ncbi:ABC transporter ATP-binding protein [Pseudonocardia abyssalis]|uniref:ATP-binding cassette domain-containing protein n=1 Tax=Pseudonocardia abyssalis TaxID=2792008 RepID=A0ABS6UWT2_9PSEU|nr:ATP-binding cassette domain-containing protein [Pseudonocardia abyssalis]MBW0115500.1 ATP-binding cassette domain-containing protein [Pseudonocardia abyssalis]MBW0136704.1 ATP-binding cassette domain-containing protein [Pseudonocardia abyssalis]